MRGLGADVRDVTIPSIWASPAFMVIMLTEAFAYHARDLRERPQLYGEVLREKLMAGALFTADEYVQAQRLRARLCEDVNHGPRRGRPARHADRAGHRPAVLDGLDPELPVRAAATWRPST